MNKRWISIIVGVLTVLVTISAWYYQLAEREYMQYELKASLYETRDRLEMTQIKLGQILDERIAKAPKSIELAALDQKFSKLEEKIVNVEKSTLGLRQAINPSKPEEILTIARLTDEVKSIRKDFQELSDSLSSQQKTFSESVLREMKSSSDSSTLILVVLIPLVFNFLYTIWKDARSEEFKRTLTLN